MRGEKMNSLKIVLAVGIIAAFTQSGIAREQKYERVYQKTNKVVQKSKTVKQDVQWRRADAYLSVSRDRPTVSVNKAQTQTEFQIAPDKADCGGRETYSCFRSAVGFNADVDCDRSVIVLTVEQKQPPVMVVSSKFKKDKCLFDKIVKHELTHEKIFRSVLDSYVLSLSQKLIAVYENGQRDGLSCKEIKENIDKPVSAAEKEHARLQSERGRQIDAPDGAHAYGFETCRSTE